jgi:hypothetical protein
MVNLPSNVNYGTVVGRFLIAKSDGSDVDLYPDGAAAQGSVFFTPSVSKLLNISAGPAPVTIIPATYESVLDSEGYLLGEHGGRGVRLIATNDPDMNPTNWTWKVSYRLTDDNGVAISGIPDYSIQLPSNGQVDLTLLTPVSESNGSPSVIGPTGPTGPQGNLDNLTGASPIVFEENEISFDWAATSLDQIDNVNFINEANGDMVKYNSNTSKWQNSNIIDGGTA